MRASLDLQNAPSHLIISNLVSVYSQLHMNISENLGLKVQIPLGPPLSVFSKCPPAQLSGGAIFPVVKTTELTAVIAMDHLRFLFSLLYLQASTSRQLFPELVVHLPSSRLME
jgi:hypothetical protein